MASIMCLCQTWQSLWPLFPRVLMQVLPCFDISFASWSGTSQKVQSFFPSLLSRFFLLRLLKRNEQKSWTQKSWTQKVDNQELWTKAPCTIEVARKKHNWEGLGLGGVSFTEKISLHWTILIFCVLFVQWSIFPSVHF